MDSTKHVESYYIDFPNYCPTQKKIKEEGTPPNSFITQISKLDQSMTKKELHTNIPDEHRHQNPQQNNSKPNATLHEKIHSQQSSGIYFRDSGMIQYLPINVIHHIHKMKNENHTIISVASKKKNL